MSNILVTNLIEKPKLATLYEILLKALANLDAAEVIGQFNKFLAVVPYDDYSSADRKKDLTFREPELDFEGFLYRACLLSFLHDAGVQILTEVNKSLCRTGIVVECEKATWVMELKVSRKDDDEKVLLNEAGEKIS
jgi:hypothetical protein